MSAENAFIVVALNVVYCVSSLRMTVDVYRLHILRKYCNKETCFLRTSCIYSPFSPPNNTLFSVLGNILGNTGLPDYMEC